MKKIDKHLSRSHWSNQSQQFSLKLESEKNQKCTPNDFGFGLNTKFIKKILKNAIRIIFISMLIFFLKNNIKYKDLTDFTSKVIPFKLSTPYNNVDRKKFIQIKKKI